MWEHSLLQKIPVAVSSPGKCKYWLLTIPVRRIRSCSLLLVKKMPIRNRRCNRHVKICLQDLPWFYLKYWQVWSQLPCCFQSPFCFSCSLSSPHLVESRLGCSTTPVPHFHRQNVSTYIHVSFCSLCTVAPLAGTGFPLLSRKSGVFR